MNQADTAFVPQRTIVVEHDLPHAPEKVWRALTEADLLAKWLMPNDIRATVGQQFTFQTMSAPGFDGIAHCEILAAEPFRRLQYTFRGGSHERQGYGAYLDTIITWTLTPTDTGGTLLRLEHAGFTAESAVTFGIMSKGWAQLGNRLDEMLTTLPV